MRDSSSLQEKNTELDEIVAALRMQKHQKSGLRATSLRVGASNLSQSASNCSILLIFLIVPAISESP